MAMGKLDQKIEQAMGISIEGDSRVLQAKQRLKEFKARREELSKALDNMAAEAVAIESESAKRMLEGRPTDIKQLTALATKKSETEAEVKILQSVIETAERQTSDLLSQVRRESDVVQWRVLSAAFEEFIQSLQPSLEQVTTLERALSLRVGLTIGHRLRNALDNFRNFSREISDSQDVVLSTIQELSAK